jgi:hypothetical protein
MKFTAHVTMINKTETQDHESEVNQAKAMLIKALQILSKSNSNIMQEAEEFLKGANA